MKPAQDKPHKEQKLPEKQSKEPEFSQADAEGKALSQDRQQHGETVDEPDEDEAAKEQ